MTAPNREWPADEMGYQCANWHPHLIAGLVASYPRAVYIEIGVLRGECWQIAAPHAAHAHAVDAADYSDFVGVLGQFWHMESDDFFRAYDGPAPDVVFVDGAHHQPTCSDDVDSALAILAPGGTVAIHDTLPRPITRWDLSGDGWQVRERLEADSTLECFTFWRYPGLTLVRKR